MPSKVGNSAKKEEQAEIGEGEGKFSSFVKAKKKKKPLKKEKVEKDENNLGCPNKEKKNQQQQQKKKNASSAEARTETIKVNKEEPNKDDEPANEKILKEGEKEKKIKTKKLLEEEEKEKKKKAVAGEAIGKKKMFDLPGQKCDPPEERDPLRIFYEALYHQLPHSEMAAIWMMEYGLLPREVAETVHEKKQMKKNQLKLRSPAKAVASMKKTTKSVTVNKTRISPDSTAKKKSASKTELKVSKKHKMDDSVWEDETNDDDDDFVSRKTKKKSKA